MRETGFLLGPALAAGLLAVTTPAIVLGVNAATFALSALALLPLRGHVREVTADAPGAEPDRRASATCSATGSCGP